MSTITALETQIPMRVGKKLHNWISKFDGFLTCFTNKILHDLEILTCFPIQGHEKKDISQLRMVEQRTWYIKHNFSKYDWSALGI